MKNILIIIVTVLLVSGFVLFKKDTLPGSDNVMCTMEAKLCPDGSYVGRQGPQCEFASCPTVSVKTYSSPTSKFFIKYPSDFTVNENYAYTLLGPGKDIHGVSFTIPLPMSQGTNLSVDSYVSVEQLNKKSCKATDFLDHGKVLSPVAIGEFTFDVAQTSGAGAGNLYEETVYALPNCQAIRYMVHSTNIGNYEPGAVTEFNRESLIKLFDSIRDSYDTIAPM